MYSIPIVASYQCWFIDEIIHSCDCREGWRDGCLNHSVCKVNLDAMHQQSRKSWCNTGFSHQENESQLWSSTCSGMEGCKDTNEDVTELRHTYDTAGHGHVVQRLVLFLSCCVVCLIDGVLDTQTACTLTCIITSILPSSLMIFCTSSRPSSATARFMRS